MADEIAFHVKQIEQSLELKEYKKIVDSLDALANVEVDLKILQKTGVGRVVGKMRKHDKPLIAQKSKTLVDKWKTIVEEEANNENNKRKKQNDDADYKDDEEEETPKKRSNSATRKSKSCPSRLSSSAESVPSSPAPSPSQSKDYRQTARKKLFDALQGAGIESFNDEKGQELAAEIEEALQTNLGENLREYGVQLRTIAINLPKNLELSTDVWNHAISAAELVAMDSADMATKELKEKRKKTEDWFMKASQAGTGEEGGYSTQFTCGKCKQKKTKYTQVQTRSADEPMTIFILCVNCGNRWKQ